MSRLVRAFSTRRLVGRVEGREVHRLGALDHRHDEPAAAVLPLHVHREPERDALGLDPVGSARPASARVWPMTGCCLVACTSAKAMRWVKEILPDLPAALKSLVEPPPPLLQRRHRDHPEGRRRGDGEALVHVGDELGLGPLDGDGARRAGRWRARRPMRPAARRSRGRLEARPPWPSAAGRPVAGGLLADDPALEQPAPLRSDRRGVPEKLLVHRLREASVGRLEYVRIHVAHHPDRCAHELGSPARPETLEWDRER